MSVAKSQAEKVVEFLTELAKHLGESGADLIPMWEVYHRQAMLRGVWVETGKLRFPDAEWGVVDGVKWDALRFSLVRMVLWSEKGNPLRPRFCVKVGDGVEYIEEGEIAGKGVSEVFVEVWWR